MQVRFAQGLRSLGVLLVVAVVALSVGVILLRLVVSFAVTELHRLLFVSLRLFQMFHDYH